MPQRKPFRPASFVCHYRHCRKACKTSGGLRRHIESAHQLPQSLTGGASAQPLVPPQAQDDLLAMDVDELSPGMEQDDLLEQGPPSPASPSEMPLPDTAPEKPKLNVSYHPLLDGTPCDLQGNDLPPNSSPLPRNECADTDFTPFVHRAEFEFAEFLFTKAQMSGGNLTLLMQLLSALYKDTDPPFADAKDLYTTIDSITQGDIPWQSFSVTYDGDVGTDPAPWKTAQYEVWFRDPLLVMEQQIGNPDFVDGIDYAPKQVVDDQGRRQYSDLLSGNWAWLQADKIAEEDVKTHGATFVPVVLGSDKTTVSVGTGENQYYPLYASTGLVHNNVRRSHRNAVSIIGFLAIPKASREYQDDEDFRKFRRQLFHVSIHHILSSLRCHMSTPRITRCADNHFRRCIYGIGPYIADYPEQVLLACIVYGWCARCTAPAFDLDGLLAGRRSHEHTECALSACTLQELWNNYGIVGDLVPFTTGFPRADIHELLSPDILHQIIKGTFKDHIVDWVVEYIKKAHSLAEAARILADVDRRVAAVPHFPGLRRFKQGRNFKQWTGDDSKALMKVFLPAIVGHVPDQMVRAVSAFTEFCYLVRRSVITEDTLSAIDKALADFHREREIFRTVGIRPEGFSLPRQHSLKHYRRLIEMFGAPNGLCSSITENKHIKAVKEPWRRSNRNDPLGQMLLTNQRLDKLAAARVDFTARSMLQGPCNLLEPLLLSEPEREASPCPLPPLAPQEEDELAPMDGPKCLGEVKLAKGYARKYPRDVDALGTFIGCLNLKTLIENFLFEQQNHNIQPDQNLQHPSFSGNVFVYHSAVATYFAPSDLAGVGGMHKQRFRAVPSWYHGAPRYDCVIVEHDPLLDGFQGLHVARVFLLFSFTHAGIQYPCALVQWFTPMYDRPCDKTGMWIVTPDSANATQVIHLDSILRDVHLIGVAGNNFLPKDFTYSDSLDAFKAFYVNKYADYHAHEILF